MRVINNTNIIVDNFDYCKNFPRNTFIHFLTHFHADHWVGMTPVWDYGMIYCTAITKQLILEKFPGISNITALELNTKYTISLRPNNPDLMVDVYLFDANHIPGSAMILFKGYMGTILHTGDMRFHDEMLNNPILFPPELVNEKKKSIHIDELIFDNTYLHPMFKFPPREEAMNEMVQVIEKNMGKHIIVSIGILGKQELLISLADRFKTKILIPEEKFKQFEAIGYRIDIFTIHKGEGFIELIGKHQRLQRLEAEKQAGNKNFLMISTDFTMFEGDLKANDGFDILVPYSQHSNYPELEKFVKSIQPCILKKLVIPYETFSWVKNRPIDFLAGYLGYLKNLAKGGDSAYRKFLQNYTQIHKLSKEYKHWMNPEAQKKIMEDLGLSKNADKSLRRKRKQQIEDKKLVEIEKKFPEKKLLEIERKVLPSQGDKRYSFARSSNKMIAVNENMNISGMLVAKGKSNQSSKGGKEELEEELSEDKRQMKDQMEEGKNGKKSEVRMMTVQKQIMEERKRKILAIDKELNSNRSIVEMLSKKKGNKDVSDTNKMSVSHIEESFRNIELKEKSGFGRRNRFERKSGFEGKVWSEGKGGSEEKRNEVEFEEEYEPQIGKKINIDGKAHTVRSKVVASEEDSMDYLTGCWKNTSEKNEKTEIDYNPDADTEMKLLLEKFIG